MSRYSLFVKTLAEFLLVNNWREPAMVARIYWLLDDRPAWVKPLVKRIIALYASIEVKPNSLQLAQFIDHDAGFRSTWSEHHHTLHIKRYYLQPVATGPALIECDQPDLDNVKQLANWLGLAIGQLENYSQHWRQQNSHIDPHQQHYYYHWRMQKGLRKRLIEAPKQRLADAQQQIYLGILDRIPLHDACHGFRKGHSRLSYVETHTGKAVVIKIDLLNFFTSIPLRRIHALFTTLGYSNHVTRRLAGLCCNQTPEMIIRKNARLSLQQCQQLRTPHLPQGSPSSPALANLCAFKLDIRLNALAKKFDADYSRYADDLAFSGDHILAHNAQQLISSVINITKVEGFSVNHQKTRIMRQGVSQRLTGITLNRFANCSRKTYEQLKAILYNCVKFGPESQNHRHHPSFRAHLQGRIAEIRSLNPGKAVKLEHLFNQISW